jgi:DNA-binding protein HU-beta
MNKEELIKAVARSAGMTQVDVSVVIHEAIEQIKLAVSNGEAVRISGLFNLAISRRPERMVRVPGTDRKTISHAVNLVKIKPATALSSAANGGAA